MPRISQLGPAPDASSAEIPAERLGNTVRVTPEQIVTSRLSSTTPAALGTAAVGVGTTAARADHVHAHGNLGGGALHADVVAGGASGFMTGAQATRLDSLGGFEYFFGASLTQNPDANVYSSWAAMFAAIALLPTGVTPVVWIMENTTVPAGTWDMRLGTLRSPVLATGAITLLCPDGVTLDNLAVIENGLAVEMSPTTVAGSSLTFSMAIGVDVLLVGLGAALRNTGTEPLWVTPGGGGFNVLAINGVSWDAFSPPVITAPLIRGTAGDIIILSTAVSLAQMPADWIDGDGTLIYSTPVNEEATTLSGWAGTTVIGQSQVVYPALAAQYAGSVAVAPVASGGTYNVVRGDELVRVAPTGVGGISVVLPDPALFSGQTVTVKKTTSDVIDAVTMTTVAGLIDGLASYPLPASAYSVLGFRSDGTDWWVVRDTQLGVGVTSTSFMRGFGSHPSDATQRGAWALPDNALDAQTAWTVFAIYARIGSPANDELIWSSCNIFGSDGGARLRQTDIAVSLDFVDSSPAFTTTASSGDIAWRRQTRMVVQRFDNGNMFGYVDGAFANAFVSGAAGAFNSNGRNIHIGSDAEGALADQATQAGGAQSYALAYWGYALRSVDENEIRDWFRACMLAGGFADIPSGGGLSRVYRASDADIGAGTWAPLIGSGTATRIGTKALSLVTLPLDW